MIVATILISLASIAINVSMWREWRKTDNYRKSLYS